MAELYDSWCRQLRANGDRLGEGEDCLLLFYTPGSELLQSRAAGGHSVRRGGYIMFINTPRTVSRYFRILTGF